MTETAATSFAGRTTSTALPTADFWSRASAFAIDLALLAGLHVGFFTALAGFLFPRVPLDLGTIFWVTIAYGGLFLTSPLALALAYFTILHAQGGQTVGKLILGIQVVDSRGESLTFGSAFLRTVSYLISALPLGAGFLWAVLDREGRAWHDHLAATRVVVLL